MPIATVIETENEPTAEWGDSDMGNEADSLGINSGICQSWINFP